jgi:hypothetical protein
MELNQYEKKIYSQNGEDGIIEEIFNRISPSNRCFVEFGVETGIQCNCRYLYEKFWNGLMIEGSKEMYQSLLENYGQGLVAFNEFITKENIVSLFNKAKVPKTFDILSIDIDGNDYWVLKEILKEFTPNVIVSEYNAYHKPPEEWIMKYNPEHTWDGTSYQGVSLQSLTKMCNNFGYALVATDSNGVNAFYIKRGLIEDKFKELTPIEAYHPARYFGHMNNGNYGHPFKDGEFVKE